MSEYGTLNRKDGEETAGGLLHAFPNGTAFYDWFEAWCGTCVHDRATETQGEGMCQIPVPGLIGEPVPDWGRGPNWSPKTSVYCKKYQPVEVGGDAP